MSYHNSSLSVSYISFDSQGLLFLNIIRNYYLGLYCVQLFWHTDLKCTFILLSHPSPGWLYVVSSFPPPHLRLHPLPPQRLFLSRPNCFTINFTYVGQRKYRSGEMYWMTFPWPWPKVMAVALINKNLLVCTIKLELLIRSLQNLVALSS